MSNSTELYAFVFKDTGEILTPKSLDAYWRAKEKDSPHYFTSGRVWKPSKKVYYTEGMAKSGFSYIPDEMKPNLRIAIFREAETLIDGEELMEVQKKLQAEKYIKKQKKAAERQKAFAENEIVRLKREIKRLS